MADASRIGMTYADQQRRKNPIAAIQEAARTAGTDIGYAIRTGDELLKQTADRVQQPATTPPTTPTTSVYQTMAEEYEAALRASAEKQQANISGIYGGLKAQAEKDYRAAADETARSYRPVFDANAIDELVARRNAREAIANSNMANSGLNNTQQTAISLMRGNADSQTALQQRAAVDSIMRQLDALKANYDAEEASAKMNIGTQLEQDIFNYRQSMKQAEAEAAQSAQQALVDQYAAAEQQAYDRQLDYLKLGYEYDPVTGQKTYIGTAAANIATVRSSVERALANGDIMTENAVSTLCEQLGIDPASAADLLEELETAGKITPSNGGFFNNISKAVNK